MTDRVYSQQEVDALVAAAEATMCQLAAEIVRRNSGDSHWTSEAILALTTALRDKLKKEPKP